MSSTTFGRGREEGLLVVVALAVSLIAASWGSAPVQHTGTGTQEMKLEPGFRPLFNGKDLKGWHKNPVKIGHGTGGRWTVVEGAISGEQDPPDSGNGGILLTDERFGNFEVIFQTKPDWGMDSGFFLRSTDDGKCYQIMIDYYETGNIGEIYREGLDGRTNRTFQLEGIYTDVEKHQLKGTKAVPAANNELGAGGTPYFNLADWPKIWKINDWNTIRARVQGNPPTITNYLNGQLITRYTSDKKFEGTLPDRGSLALQVHGGAHGKGRTRFRNIQVKEL